MNDDVCQTSLIAVCPYIYIHMYIRAGTPPVLNVPTADWTSGQASHEYPSFSGPRLSYSLTSYYPSHYTRCADTHAKAGEL